VEKVPQISGNWMGWEKSCKEIFSFLRKIARIFGYSVYEDL
jgi:hypothetical protein